MKNLFRRKTTVPVEPGPHHEPGPCLNCGTNLSEDDLFCPHCGQKRLSREDMSFRHLIGDSFLDYFHFDSKFFRTILPLLYKPGWLTVEYMRGRRKSFVEPFKLFLVISVIYFLLLSFGKEPAEEKTSPVRSDSAMLKLDKKNDLKDVTITLKGIPVTKSSRDSIKNEIDSTGLKRYVEKHYAKESFWTKLFVRQAIKIMLTKGQSFTTVLEHTASKLIFLLIPVFAGLLKLFYIRRKRLYFEHLIFSLHLHAFIFILLILYLLIELIFPLSWFFILMIILVYGFIALKKYYGQGIGKTIIKMLLISLSYMAIGVPLFFMLLMLVAVLSF